MKYFVVFLAVFFVVVQGKPADDEHGQLANGKDKEDDCTEEDGCERRRDSDDHDQLANGKDKEEDCTEEDGCERRRDTGDCSCKDFVEPLYGFGNCEKEVPWVGRKVCFVNLPTTCEDAGVCPHYPDMKYSFNACD